MRAFDLAPLPDDELDFGGVDEASSSAVPKEGPVERAPRCDGVSDDDRRDSFFFSGIADVDDDDEPGDNERDGCNMRDTGVSQQKH